MEKEPENNGIVKFEGAIKYTLIFDKVTNGMDFTFNNRVDIEDDIAGMANSQRIMEGMLNELYKDKSKLSNVEQKYRQRVMSKLQQSIFGVKYALDYMQVVYPLYKKKQAKDVEKAQAILAKEVARGGVPVSELNPELKIVKD